MVIDFLIKHQVTNVMAINASIAKTIGIAIAILFAASIVIVIAIHCPNIANNPVGLFATKQRQIVT
jgi:hypothetical protein